jgi:hypothetical protein
VTEEVGKGRFGKILGRNPSDQDSTSLSGGGMGGADKKVLPNANVMSHLVFDIPPNPYYGKRTSGIIAREGAKVSYS